MSISIMRAIVALLFVLFILPALPHSSPADHFIPYDRNVISKMPDHENVTLIVLGLVDSPYAIKKLPHLGYTILHGPKIALLNEVSKTPYLASLPRNYTLDSLAVNIGEGIPFPQAPYGRNYLVNGSGITVAVIDTGVDPTHPSLQGKIIGRYDANGEFANPTDPGGHGTLVASIIAGKPLSGDVHFSDFGIAPEPGYGYPFALRIPEETTVYVRLSRDNSTPGYDMALAIYTPSGGQLIVDTSTETLHVEERSGDVEPGTLRLIAATTQGSTGYNFTRVLEVRFHTDVPVGGGIAPGAMIYGVKVFQSGSESTDTTYILAGLDHVLAVKDQYNIRVVNLSLGTTLTDPALDDAMRQLVLNGILPVVSAGNSGPSYYTVGSPAESPRSLAVGASTIYGSVAYYSSRGNPNEQDVTKIKPDVLAVGGGIYVGPMVDGAETNAPDYGFSTDIHPNDLTAAIGTSFSAPAVAGIAALVFSAMPNANPLLVKYLISAGTYETINIGHYDEPSGENSNLPSLDRIGKDAVEGRGMTYLPAIMNATLMEYEYGSMPNFTLTFGPDLGEPKVYAFKVKVTPGTNVTFSLMGTTSLDVDMLVLSLDEAKIEANLGNPVIVAASTSTTSRESVSFVANESYYLLIIRRVSGSGSVTLTYHKIEDTEPPEIHKVRAFMLYKYLSLSVSVSDNYGVTAAMLVDQNGKSYYLKPRSDTERYYSGLIDEVRLEGKVIVRDVGGNTASADVKANGRYGLIIAAAFTLLILGLAVLLIKKTE